MRVIFDNGKTDDNRFLLEEDDDGLLYETNNAVTHELVCSRMFLGWDNLSSEEWCDELTVQFDGDRDAAERYQRAALDLDK